MPYFLEVALRRSPLASCKFSEPDTQSVLSASDHLVAKRGAKNPPLDQGEGRFSGLIKSMTSDPDTLLLLGQCIP